MHRLPIVAGLALSVVAAGTTFAATPKTAPSTTAHVAAPAAAQVWTAKIAGTTAKGAATLVVRAGHTSGRAHVNVHGLTTGTTAEAVIFERSAKGVVTIVSTDKATISAKAGTLNIAWPISKAAVAKLEAALKAKDTLMLEVKDGKTVVRTDFVPKA